MKRIETVKNRVKTELKISVQVVDVKQKKIAEFFDTQHKKLQQIFPNGNVFPIFGVFLTGAKTTF